VYVTRVGKTDRRVARVRLATLDRLPLRLLGVVLNGIRADGMFRDYAYQPEYAAGASGPNATSERGIASVLQAD